MPISVWARVNQGKIELLEPIELPEGATVLITLVPAPTQPLVNEQPPQQAKPKPPTPEPIPLETASIEPDAWFEPTAEDTIWDTLEDQSGKPFLPVSSPLPTLRSE